MKKFTFILLLAGMSLTMHAQHFKIALSEGIGIDPNKKQDSLFFAQSYTCTQLRLGYHYGKLGLILNANYIVQKMNREMDGLFSLDPRVPQFMLGVERTFSDVKTLNATLGIELCIPLIRHKGQFNFYLADGISQSNGKLITFYKNLTESYYHSVEPTITNCFQAGFSFNYKLNSYIALKWQNEFNAYKLPFEGVDTRKSPNTYTGRQRKSILITSLGLQYTF